MLGASDWRIFQTVTLPATRYGLASAVFVVFTNVITDFGNPMVMTSRSSGERRGARRTRRGAEGAPGPSVSVGLRAGAGVGSYRLVSGSDAAVRSHRKAFSLRPDTRNTR